MLRDSADIGVDRNSPRFDQPFCGSRASVWSSRPSFGLPLRLILMIRIRPWEGPLAPKSGDVAPAPFPLRLFYSILRIRALAEISQEEAASNGMKLEMISSGLPDSRIPTKDIGDTIDLSKGKGDR
jgi:hypothetical protein